MLRRVVLAIVLLLPALGVGQSVRSADSGPGRSLRTATALAKRENEAGWPDLYEGESGTVVLATFDHRNADLTLVTAYGSSTRLLRSAQAAAKTVGASQADFLTFSTPRYESVDVELNDELVRPDSTRTRIEIPLGRWIEAWEGSGVPKPVAVALRVDPLTRATLDGRELAPGTHLFLAGEIPRGATLVRSSERPWWAIPATVVLVVGVVALMLGLAAIPLLALRRLNRASIPTAEAPTAEEVQRRYDSIKPWVAHLPTVAPVVALLGLTLGKTWIELAFAGAAMVLPPPPPWTFALLLLPVFGMLPVVLLKVWRRRSDDPGSGSAHPEDGDESAGTRWLGLAPLAALPGFLLVMARTSFPNLRNAIGIETMFALFIGLPAVAVAVSVVLSMRASRGDRIVLAPGDPIHDAAHELAARAGVRIRKVVVRRSAAPNAFADLGANVGVTTRLRRELPPEELRAILAHEVGHLRHRHVWRGFAISLAALALWLGLRLVADGWARTRLSSSGYALWSSPLWGFFLFPLVSAAAQGRGSRARELEADRFAAEAVGDPEIVVRALERVHLLAQSPGAPRRADELLSTHPSLVRRIAALRSATAPAL